MTKTNKLKNQKACNITYVQSSRWKHLEVAFIRLKVAQYDEFDLKDTFLEFMDWHKTKHIKTWCQQGRIKQKEQESVDTQYKLDNINPTVVF